MYYHIIPLPSRKTKKILPGDMTIPSKKLSIKLHIKVSF